MDVLAGPPALRELFPSSPAQWLTARRDGTQLPDDSGFRVPKCWGLGEIKCDRQVLHVRTLEEHLRKPHRFVFLVQWCRVWLGPGPITRHDHDGLTQVCPGGGGGGGADLVLDMCVCVFVHTYQLLAPNCGGLCPCGHDPPGRVPVHTAPKNPPFSSPKRR